VVRPGAILTGRNRDVLADRIPLGRVGTPDDCVGAVMLICSDAGAYINGAVMAVDGGMRL
jgi:NAD(P)-dependent dehydrogenase (short-subunit alcohol dehydrogenase family)